MGKRKLKLISFRETDPLGEVTMQFSRPLTRLELAGLEWLIERKLANGE